MSFTLFIYYCMIAGGWAAFMAAMFVLGGGVLTFESPYVRSIITGGLVGAFVAAAIGLIDAILNDKGAQRIVRMGLCGILGIFAGAIGGAIGELGTQMVGLPYFFGWMLAGILIGASIGAFDVLRGLTGGGDLGSAIRKVINGIMGGFLGGFLGGLSFGFVQSFEMLTTAFPRSSLTASLVILGMLIGLAIGLAQVMLKEAWIKVEEGFRAGRELMLSKEETTIGRAESCDLGLFGDNTIQKVHARIVRENNRFVLKHAADEGETYLNDELVPRKGAPLRAGDRIRIGKSVLQFGERQTRK